MMSGGEQGSWSAPLGRALRGDAAGIFAATCALGFGGTALLTGGAAVLGPVVPADPLVFAWGLAAAGMATAGWWLPLAVALGIASACTRWQEEGAWRGLQLAGVGPGPLRRQVSWLALGAVACTLLLTTLVAPASQRAARGALHAARSAVVVRPGQWTSLGDAWLRAGSLRDGDPADIEVWSEAVRGRAKTARAVLREGTLYVRLSGGHWQGRDWHADFSRWDLPVPVPERRLGLDERSLVEVLSVARRTAAAGGDPRPEYAEACKRLLHPLAVLPLALIAGSGRRRGAWWVGGSGLGYLVAVRLSDALARTWVPAVGIPLLLLSLLAALSSRRSP